MESNNLLDIERNFLYTPFILYIFYLIYAPSLRNSA